ncbi:hypothetical protein AaE_003259 [Aphanomyces astaci]|uniref:Peptidase A2 domain-containing protein n=1 Tax=Aphanomyces astaci TaxID=112090 RepID=A0A6A5ASJ5_APHAT|nr:hypothetical protein AaE_003259 [Aphanomyces astaci]
MQAKRMKKPPPPSKEDDGRWVRLNSVLEVPYCPDTGADQIIVPLAMVDELQALQPQLQVVKLAAPFVGTACNQMPFEASSYVDLTLTMQTAAGPVKVPGKRRCYVVNDGDEFLVSDDTLKNIGIDACWNRWRACKWMRTAMTWKKLVAIAWNCPNDRPSEPRP